MIMSISCAVSFGVTERRLSRFEGHIACSLSVLAIRLSFDPRPLCYHSSEVSTIFSRSDWLKFFSGRFFRARVSLYFFLTQHIVNTYTVNFFFETFQFLNYMLIYLILHCPPATRMAFRIAVALDEPCAIMTAPSTPSSGARRIPVISFFLDGPERRQAQYRPYLREQPAAELPLKENCRGVRNPSVTFRTIFPTKPSHTLTFDVT
jgi:hypothetical protein